MVDVLVVDDDEIERAGRELVLDRRGHRVVGVGWGDLPAIDHDAEVVLAVVRRDPSSFDRWDRVRAAGRLDELGRAGSRTIALTADPVPVSPIARLRLRRAGAAGVLTTASVSTGDLLDDLVRAEQLAVNPPGGSSGRVVIGPRCDPGSVVEHVLGKAAQDPAFADAFEPGLPRNQTGISRRRSHTLRVKVAELGDLRAVPPSSGGPVRDLSIPRWTDIVSFVNQCRVWDATDHLRVDQGSRP